MERPDTPCIRRNYLLGERANEQSHRTAEWARHSHIGRGRVDLHLTPLTPLMTRGFSMVRLTDERVQCCAKIRCYT